MLVTRFLGELLAVAASDPSHESAAVRVDSRPLFIVLVAGCVVYLAVLVDLARRLPEGIVTFALYSLAGLVLAAATWSSATVLELHADHIRQVRLFGLGPSSLLAMRDVVRVLVRPNHDGYVTRVTITGAHNERLALHRYQRNFQAARSFLTRNLRGVPEELESKWRL